MKALAEFIVKHLVDHPDRVVVSEVDGHHTSVLELIVAGGEVGQVIGKNGRTADALRTILGAVAAKHRKRMVLEIIDRIGA